MLIAYISKKGLEVFSQDSKGYKKLATGNPEELKPFRSFDRKLLIVGRDICLHIRKKYPPASEKMLRKAIMIEAEELFPIKSLQVYSNIFETTDTYSLVDIWGWDVAVIEAVRSVFPFGKAIPEEALYNSQTPQAVVICEYHYSTVIAFNEKGFLRTASFKTDRVDSRAIELFLRGLGRYYQEIKEMVIYKGCSIEIKDISMAHVSVMSKEPPMYPLCLEYIKPGSLMSLKDIDISLPSALDVQLLLRCALYIAAAAGLAFYISAYRYDLASIELNQKIKGLNVQVSEAVSTVKEGDIDIGKELVEKEKEFVRPLKLLDRLARLLPEKSVLTRVSTNNREVELSIVTREPFYVLKVLSDSDILKNVKMKGAPAKDPSGKYTLQITSEIR